MSSASERLRALADAATPGPWAWHSGGYFDSGARIVNLGNAENPTKYPVLDCDALGDPDEADARLIALAPELARLAADLAEALARRVEEDECGLDEPGTECVWCHEDRALLARLDGVAAGKDSGE